MIILFYFYLHLLNIILCEPFNLDFFEKELTFTIDTYFINKDYEAHCVLYASQNENKNIEKTKVSTCYIELNNDICNFDDI